MEIIEILKEFGALGLVAIMVVLANQWMSQQIEDYLETTRLMLDWLRDLCSDDD